MEKSFSSLPSVLKRRFLPALATFVSVIGASIVYVVSSSPVYQVTGRLMLDEKKVSVSELGREISQLEGEIPGQESPLATQVELIKSQPVLLRTINQLFPNEEALISTDDLKEGLNTKIVPATNILELSYESENPELATRLLNTVLQVMVQESSEAIRSEARSLREFLEAELPKRRAAAEAAEAALSKYKQATGLVSVEEQTNNLITSLASLEQEKQLLAAQVQEANGRVESLRQTTGLNLEDAYVGGRIGQDEELVNLRTKLAELDEQLTAARSRFTDENPTVISLLEEQEALLALYEEKVARLLPPNQSISSLDIASDELSQTIITKFIEAETERLALQEKLKAVQVELTQLQYRLEQLPIAQKPFAALLRQQEEANNSLKFLQSKLEEARIAEAQLFSNLKIIEEAELPSEPSGPNQKAMLVLAIVAGVILAVGIILVLELIDNTLHEDLAVEELLNLPKLGSLPDLPASALVLEPPEQFLDDGKLVEPYRLLLKKLEFCIQEEKLQLIVVSSTVSGEGKSVVVSHLAAVSAMLSQRTLIIDADLRQPRQHNFLAVVPEPGLADVIQKKLSLLEAVQPTEIENLSILTCGELSTRPSALLESPAMKSLLAEAAAHYDLVIVDTPPVTGCADAHTLSQRGNGLVMIARPEFTHKNTLVQAVSELQGNGTPLLGIVFNGMTARSQKYYQSFIDSYPPLSKPQKNLKHLENSPQGAGKVWNYFIGRG
ncbi:MAG: polysaccharide biosynthesis tyrosine autokinase [Symploca sp. SIO3E6]|nr:polysaccharide biosynthesis tyrosine autokinase [Caldora sp. SIO3E6]